MYIGKLVYTEDGTSFQDLHSDKKIGITKNLDARAQNLTDTNSPFVWVPIKAWERKDGECAQPMEATLHSLKRESRVAGLTSGKKSEWFNDSEDLLVDDISTLMDNHPEWKIHKGLEETTDLLVRKVGNKQSTERYSTVQYLTVLEGLTLRSHAYTKDIRTDVGVATAQSYFVGEENDAVTYDCPFEAANSAFKLAKKLAGVNNNSGTNFKKSVFDVETGKSVGQLMSEYYSE